MTTAVASACPDENALVRFARGTSDDGEVAQLEAHLDGCDGCRRAVAAAASDETLGAGAAPSVLEPGDRLGRYEVAHLLGVGGMGVVYAGRDPRLGRRVALKRLHGATTGDAHARLVREAQAMAQLSHPNVVPIFELGDDDSGVFFAMELVDGVTLRDWLRQPRGRGEVLERFLEAGRGLAAAHAAGVVHRDFKPSNVLVGADGRARVTDFGLARPLEAPNAALQAGSDLTQAGALLGTLAYMSPEQLQGRPADARSDQFSFCLALAEALGGRRLFEGETAARRLESMARPPGLGPRISGRLRAVLAKGLAVDPSGRFGSMAELLAALEGARKPGRGRWLALGAVAVVVVGIVVVALRPAAPAGVPRAEPPPSFDAKAGVVTLAPGQFLNVATEPFSTVTSSDEAIAQVAPSTTGFTVRGVAPGVACLVVREAAGARRISARVGVVSGEPCAEAPRADALPSMAAVPAPAQSSIVVGVGEKTLVWIPGLQRVAIGDDSVADVAVAEKAVLEVSGRAPGETSLIVWAGEERRQWTVTVPAR